MSISSPPLTPPLQARKTRSQASNRSVGSIGNKNKYIVNSTYSSNGSINSKKSAFNPLDLSQIKRELTKLIKINSSSSNNMDNIVNTNTSNQKIESNKNKQPLLNDNLIGKTLAAFKTETSLLKHFKSSNNLLVQIENCDSECCKFNRKLSLK